jgi:transposase
VHTIHELAIQGTSIHQIARDLGLARNTVRKYLRGTPTAAARPNRPSKLDPHKDQIRRWVEEDHLLNCETMLERLRALGYTGQVSILKDFVQPLRPPKGGQQPVRRYETKPGEQLQFDWGEFLYEQDGVRRKLYGFTAILSYSRMRCVVFTKRCDAPTMIRCLMAACEYFGGLPRAMLTDRMKSVLLQVEDGVFQWHPLFADFMAAIGVAPRVCKPYTPQTKGKIERSVGIVKQDFWPGITFTDVDDLNQQARSWYERRNQRIHRTTGQRPVARWQGEGLQPVPSGWAWERWATEDRKVSWDGYLSYDGVLYGLPAAAGVVGGTVQVRDRQGVVSVWYQGQMLLTVAKRPHSRELVPHPDQFRNVPPAAVRRRVGEPLGHQMPPPHVAQRPLAEYDRLCGVAEVV